MLKRHLSIQKNDECCLTIDFRRQWVVVQKSEGAVDPRIRRTRLLLQEALAKLLTKKDFNDVSIQDIADEATVNRATFYDHYPDKSALLACMVGCRFHQLLADRQIQFEGSCRSELKAIVRAVCDYLTRMQGPKGKRQVGPDMESAIIAAVRGILLAGLKQHVPGSAMAPEMIAASASWAIFGAAKEWAQTPNRCSPEEVADTVTMLVSPMLQIPG